MKIKRTSTSRLALILFIAVLILACSLPISKGETKGPEPTEASYPTEANLPPAATNTSQPPPTQAPPSTSSPRPTNPPLATSTQRASPTVAAQDFFLEEFTSDIDDWALFFMHGDEDLAEVYTENDRLTFFLDGMDIYAYLMYTPYYYSDVKMTAVVENRGYNNNNVSLICRYDPDEGWYEFNIANNGLYNFLFFDARENAYQFLADGGSTAIHIGKAINEYTIVCEGEKLILYINGVEAKKFIERKYVVKEGMVGISVSSFNVHPIKVDFLSVEISSP